MRRAAFALGLLLAAGGVAYYVRPRPADPPLPPPRITPVWVFQAPDPGGIVAAPLVTPDAVYLACYKARGFRLAGVVYALDPATGRPRWTFTDDGEMLPTASSPAIDRGRLYVGEGMHANFACKLYCLDAATGAKVWAYPTGDHIEAGPLVETDTVYFASGNDGVYALDARTGTRTWNFREDVHVDTTPCRVGGRVVFGTGTSRRFKRTEVIAVDAGTGKRAWRYAARWPAWGSPAAAGDRVVVGLGNGRLTEPARPPETPGGGVVCLDAATGGELWAVTAGNAVIQQPQVEGGNVYFGSWDGNLYCVALADGAKRFTVAAGGPVLSAPAVAGGRVYFATEAGVVRCLDAADGAERWTYDLGAATKTTPRVFAPVRAAGGRVYVGGEFRTDPDAAGFACLYCLPADPGGG